MASSQDAIQSFRPSWFTDDDLRSLLSGSASPSPKAGSSREPVMRRRREASDSEGSEGLAAVRMSNDRRPVSSSAVPMSQKRARQKAIEDSEDEEEGDDEKVLLRRKVAMRRPEEEQDGKEEISVPLALGSDVADETDDDVDERGRTKRAKGVGGGMEDEVVVLPTPPDTARDQARSPSIEEVAEVLGEEVMEDDHVVVEPPRRSGRSAAKQVAFDKTAETQRFKGTRSSQSKPLEDSRRQGRALPPKPIDSKRTSSRTPVDKAGKSSTRSPVPYIELTSLSPVELSAYVEWRPDVRLTAPQPPVIDLTQEEVNAAADEEDNVPFIIPRSSPPKGQPGRKATTAAPKESTSRSDNLAVSSTTRKPSKSARVEPLSKRANIPSEVGPGRKRGEPIKTYIGGRKKGKVVEDSKESSEEDERPRLKKGKEKEHVYKKKDRIKPAKGPANGVSKGGKLKKSARDPDDPEDVLTEEEENMLEDLEIDEPERFKSKTRLRKRKETPFQRKLRKLKAQREGIVDDTTESGSSSDGRRSKRTFTSDSAATTDRSSVGMDDFIVDDGGEVQEGLLPHQFSSNSAQTPEFKFKVVFHYFVLLVIGGPKVLPLRGDTANYLGPQLEDLRRKMLGFKNSRVRSQIWRAEFVKVLETYPNFKVEYLEFAEDGCDACHMSGRRSRFRVFLEGYPYDRDTHEPLDSEEEGEKTQEKKKSQRRRRSSSDSDSDVSSEDSEEEKLAREFLMGKFCKRRAEVFHAMSHWEDQLYYRVRGYYHDLLRAKFKPVPSDSEASSDGTDPEDDRAEVLKRREDREGQRAVTEKRVKRIRERGGLVEQHRDVDRVTEWMDQMGYQNKDYRWLEEVIRTSEMLEFDKSRDE